MFWNAECLPSDVRESNFILLLSTAGCWKQWPFSRFLVALSPGSVCFFSPSPFSTALAQKGQSRVTEQSCLQLSVANRVYVMYWTSSTRKKKKNTYKKQSNFSKQSKHAAHDWLHLAQEKICPSSRPSAPTEIPTSLSAQGHQTVLGLTHFS